MQEQAIKDQERAEQDAEVKRVLEEADKALHDN